MLKPVYVVLTVVTFPLGWLSSRLLLAAAFYLVFSPAALVMRLLRRDRLRRTLDRKAATYWNPKVTPSDVESYFRQY
jgi:hypothetical protein